MLASSKRAAALRAVLAAALVASTACSGSSSPAAPPPPACGGADEACGAGAECCSGSCAGGACGCSALSGRCGTSADCCTSGGPARCSGATCVAGQRPLGDLCDADVLCASLHCDASGHCAAPCLGYGAACASSDACCGGLGCAAGTCTFACGSTYDACTTDNQCCSDFRCRAGECQAGACGTAGQRCGSEADCCTAAQGGKEYFCDAYGQCAIGQPYDSAGHPPDACATDADCAGSDPCRGGYCHWPDGHQPDGHWCLDGRECAGGFCTSAAPGVPGTCCSGAGAACTAGGGSTLCCSGQELACTGTAGAQTCGACLDFGNSGPQGTAETQCTVPSQCCAGRNLGCVQGECCTMRGHACTPGSGGRECCDGALETCGNVTNDLVIGTRSNVCCGGYGAGCGAWGACCDGYVCTDGVCLKGPQLACDGPGQCGLYEDCKMEAPSAGKCCLHEMGTCTSDADCCTGHCDPALHECRYGQPYDSCYDDLDCASRSFGRWDGPVCGGNANVGALACCPVPGDRCDSAADCCEAGDSCKPPLSGSDTTTPVCCREAPSPASDRTQCCTGMSERRDSTSVTETCCAYPYMTSFTCSSSGDCCGGTGSAPSARCDLGVTNRCCFNAGQQVGAGNAAWCCSGRVDQLGSCR